MKIHYMFFFFNEKICRLSHSRVFFLCSFDFNFKNAKLKKSFEARELQCYQ